MVSRDTYDLLVERGQQDMDSEIGRFPRLFQAVDSIPGLTWPTVVVNGVLEMRFGGRRLRICQVGRGHTQGDTRSEARRVGKECVSTCRSGWSAAHYKKKQKLTKKTTRCERLQNN